MSSRQKNSWAGFLPKTAVVMSRKEPEGGVVATSDVLGRVRADLERDRPSKLAAQAGDLVAGEGNPRAELLFVGEAPGEEEVAERRPFVGKSGQLLDRMIDALGLKRGEVYLTNVVKFRPPGNRQPEADEIEAFLPYLIREIEAIRPKVIVALGTTAAHALAGIREPISELRGKFRDCHGVRLMPTFHPSYLLRNPAAKKDVWSDLQAVARELGIVIPPAKKG